jgi:uncharacterized membrane protein YphA (DoxX/SURF4 family)
MAPSVWTKVLRWIDGGYFVWRGVHKWLTPASVWMVPRVSQALPTTPLAPLIVRWVFPHAQAVGLALGSVELVAGALLVFWPRIRWAPLALFLLNGLFLLTLGFQEPHDLALNLLMGVLNLWFFTAPARR